MFSCEYCKISKNIFSYRTPQVAASRYYERSVKEHIYFTSYLRNIFNYIIFSYIYIFRFSYKLPFILVFFFFYEVGDLLTENIFVFCL